MSTDSLAMNSSATSGPLAHRRGRVPWAWGTLVLIGLGGVAGAGWVGYQQQLTSGSSEATATEARADRAASGPASDTLAAATAPPRSTAPVRREASARRGNSAGAAASAAGQPELRWPLWDFQLRQPVPPRDPPLTPPAWRLVGATLSSDGWKVVILRQGNTTPEYFGVGAVLPGGYKIQAITDEDVTFDINKREVILSYTGSR